MRDIAAGNCSFTVRPFRKEPKRQLELVYDASWYRPEALEGFVDEVRAYLEPIVPKDAADAIYAGLQRRIDAVNAWARNAPTAKVDPEALGSPETIEWVWM